METQTFARTLAHLRKLTRWAEAADIEAADARQAWEAAEERRVRAHEALTAALEAARELEETR